MEKDLVIRTEPDADDVILTLIDYEI